MSCVIGNDGNIIDLSLLHKCREDKEWSYHYSRMIEFRHLERMLRQICFEEYERLSLREEELGVGND